MKKIALSLVLLTTVSYANEDLVRVFTCEGNDAKMEVYAPSSKVYAEGGLPQSLATTRAIGYYALDLTAAGKGKPLEPVLLSLSSDKKSLVVDQITRGHITEVPFDGSRKVDFDQRFGTGAQCTYEK